MANNHLLNLVGLAKKAGRLEVGEEPVGAAARAGKAKLILVAADAAENTRRRAAHFADAGHVKWIPFPFTKAELGLVLGRSSCAMAALTDPGFAASLTAKLVALDPETYADAHKQLDAKAQKALQRQKEQMAHEKNLQKRGHKPWAVAPQGPAKRDAANAAEPGANSLRSGDQLKAEGSPRGGTPRGDGQMAREKNFQKRGHKPWAAASQGPAKRDAAKAAEPGANSLRSGDQLKAAGSPRGGTPRRDGQTAREKNIKEGKYKPWAAPPKPAPAKPEPSAPTKRPRGKLTVKKK